MTTTRLREISRFAVVGGTGFAVDATLLFVLSHLAGLDPVLARIPSFSAAMVVTWVCHRWWTFPNGNRWVHPLRQFGHYFSAQIVGVGSNYLVYSGLIIADDYFKDNPLHALTASAIATAALSYFLARAWVFPVSSNEG